MTESEQRHRELAAFLRSRRERRSPQSAGFGWTGRRRTPGLRREEVAAMAGVSTSWYTWLEQGRQIRVSRQVLSGLATALGLNDLERTHLFVLADEVPPGGAGPVVDNVPEGYRVLLEHLDPNPAFVANRRFDVLAWNRGLSSLFGDPGTVEPENRNVLWLLFMFPESRALHEDWEAEAANAVALFRSLAEDMLLRPEFASLVHRLERASDAFRAMWARRDLIAYTPGRRVLRHPSLGNIELEYVKMQAMDRAHTLVAYLAAPGSPVAQELSKCVTDQGRALHAGGGADDVPVPPPPAPVS